MMLKQGMQSDFMTEPQLLDSTAFNGSKEFDRRDSFLMLNSDSDQEPSSSSQTAQFPLKLHEMLAWSEREGYQSIVSWLPGTNTNAFKVHKKEAFVTQVMPKFFKQTQYKSFIRQLNLWDFERIVESSPNKGGYTHALFVKGNPIICKEMRRTKIKGKNSKLLSGGVTRKASRDEKVESKRLQNPSSFLPNTPPHPSNQQQEPKQEKKAQRIDEIGIFPFMGQFGRPGRIEPQEMKYVQIGMNLGRLVSKGEWPAPA
ncbi:unnamed protein product [Cylindrotheca closterium]|uniref:HSF-type DNA-binding domain-containing protein n=1 Tax=Cylindrotheca closterium TaxID=2856 RepID=A0AAD2G1R3_9STRA|nr:unnamed protein product [Cylindrotheca closterium]